MIAFSGCLQLCSINIGALIIRIECWGPSFAYADVQHAPAETLREQRTRIVDLSMISKTHDKEGVPGEDR